MIYAQIKNHVICNCIVINDIESLEIFSEGYDHLIRIDQLNPRPSIGWSYDGLGFSPISYVANEAIKSKIMDAITFGQSIIIEFAAENVMLKLTTPQILTILSKFSSIKSMLETGSLYTSLVAIQSIKPDPILMPQVRIDKYANKIKSYLGI